MKSKRNLRAGSAYPNSCIIVIPRKRQTIVMVYLCLKHLDGTNIHDIVCRVLPIPVSKLKARSMCHSQLPYRFLQRFLCVLTPHIASHFSALVVKFYSLSLFYLLLHFVPFNLNNHCVCGTFQTLQFKISRIQRKV